MPVLRNGQSQLGAPRAYTFIPVSPVKSETYPIKIYKPLRGQKQSPACAGQSGLERDYISPVIIAVTFVVFHAQGVDGKREFPDPKIPHF